ncbi:hypothetical protein BJV82DRAFT_240488 [Fennellomyces sp. T-0311]|nr:hypothetical protein BJV82DRAFT_240488 [Fennellomyces sp. T-0311]
MGISRSTTYDPHCTYFFRESARAWEISQAIAAYQQQHNNINLLKILAYMTEDLEYILKTRPRLQKDTKKMIACIEPWLSTAMKDKQYGAQNDRRVADMNTVADSWTSNGKVNIIQNITDSNNENAPRKCNANR